MENQLVVFFKNDERYHDIITLKRSSHLKPRLLDDRLLVDLDEQATHGFGQAICTGAGR